MEYVRLGKTNLVISRVAFGAMRLSSDVGVDNASSIVRNAYNSGINFFDTSSKIPETEKLLGDSLFDIRRFVCLSTATSSKTPADICQDLDNSLMNLHCDYVDLFQFETEKFIPLPGGVDNIYDTFLKLKNLSKINHIGIVTTNFETAIKAVESGCYETIQFPFSVISPELVLELVKKCEEQGVGFIAMQPLGGGVVDNIPIAFGFLQQYENVIPIWGIKTQAELEQILYFNEHPPVIDEKFNEDVEHYRNFFN